MGCNLVHVLRRIGGEHYTRSCTNAMPSGFPEGGFGHTARVNRRLVRPSLLSPSEQRNSRHPSTAAWGHISDSCTAANGRTLFDHLVGACEQCSRYREAQLVRGLEIDYKFEFCRLHHRKIGGLFTFENSPGVNAHRAIPVNKIVAVTDKAADFDEFAYWVHDGQFIAGR